MAHISFSELKDWVHCPYYHKLTRVDKIDGFTGNEYTAFGSAIHSVCEKKLLEEDFDILPKEKINTVFAVIGVKINQAAMIDLPA